MEPLSPQVNPERPSEFIRIILSGENLFQILPFAKFGVRFFIHKNAVNLLDQAGSSPPAATRHLASERFVKSPSLKAACGGVQTTSAAHASMAAQTGQRSSRNWKIRCVG